MYSTSRWTLVFVFVAWMTRLEMNFIATLWPVTECIATANHKFPMSALRRRTRGWVDALLTLPKVPSAMSPTIVYSPSLDAGIGVYFSGIVVGGVEGRGG